jgi:PPIC-type PPIASE domain
VSLRLVASVAVSLAALAACGGAPPGATGASHPNISARSADAANVAQQASEPRMGDATAAHATPMSPATGNTATVGSSSPAPAPAPAPSSSEPPADAQSGPAGAKSNATLPQRIGARHVLIQWMGSDRAPKSVVRSREQALSVAQEVLRRARNKEDFARLAIEYSDEPGAGGRGGSLGRFGRGQMVAAFEAAAFKLEVGQISDIVETPFGFHIIQRTE